MGLKKAGRGWDSRPARADPEQAFLVLDFVPRRLPLRGPFLKAVACSPRFPSFGRGALVRLVR